MLLARVGIVLIDNVIRVPAERVDRFNRLPFLFREGKKRKVEIAQTILRKIRSQYMNGLGQ